MRKYLLASTVAVTMCIAPVSVSFAQGAFNSDADARASSEANATGVGVGVGYGEGGNASATAGVENRNTNLGVNYNKVRNSNEQGQLQGQQQKQGQGQYQGQSNYGKNLQGQSLSGGANNSSQSVTVEGDDYEAPAIAPALSALTGTTCMGSTSGSAGWVGASFGLGTTWTDEECQRREAMKLLGSLPEGTMVHGVPVDEIVAEMSVGLTGVSNAVAAIKNDGSTSEDHNVSAQAEAGGNPAYCHSDSLASEATIRKNCDNADNIINAGGGSLF